MPVGAGRVLVVSDIVGKIIRTIFCPFLGRLYLINTAYGAHLFYPYILPSLSNLDSLFLLNDTSMHGANF